MWSYFQRPFGGTTFSGNTREKVHVGKTGRVQDESIQKTQEGGKLFLQWESVFISEGSRTLGVGRRSKEVQNTKGGGRCGVPRDREKTHPASHLE